MLLVFSPRRTENRPPTSGSEISPTASIDSRKKHTRSERTRDIDTSNPPTRSDSQGKGHKQSVEEGKKKAKPEPIRTSSTKRQPSSAAQEPRNPKSPKSPLMQQIKNLVSKTPGSKSGDKSKNQK